MKQIIEKVFTNSVILSGAKNLKPASSLATSHKRYSIVCSAESRGEGKGFTLAEVLITLGIIGVVAALTLPTLIQNYQKQVWVNQLKKAVSVWENGMKMMLVDADTDDLRNTEFWQSLYAINEDYTCYSNLDYSVPNNILKKYFKILKFTEFSGDNCSLGYISGSWYKQLNNGNERESYEDDCRKIYMADGTLYGFAVNYDGSRYSDARMAGILTIDVNGENKGPNQWGRDTFGFKILKNGSVVPTRSYESLKLYWYECGDLNTSNIPDGTTGYGCSTRIIADGWKMNY